MFTAVLDIIVVLLLVMTIVFCWRLNGKILELKEGRKDLINLIKSLDAAVIKTNGNIHDLKLMTESSAVELSALVQKAQEVIEDLGFMNDTAAKLADRLENDISESRYISEKLRTALNETDSQKVNDHEQAERSRPLRTGFNKAKTELLNALRVMK
jgi:wobble nucleotide-excising tRNase